jgi:GT2 family glycosyltransferase
MLASTSPKKLMVEPKVEIVILNWNGLKATCRCLKSVLQLDYTNFEVVVVDNASTDDSVASLRQHALPIKLIRNKENLGYTGGNNLVLQQALVQDVAYVWLLNNDTTAAPDSLRELVQTAESSPHIGLVTPVIYYQHTPQKILYCGSHLDTATQTRRFTRQLAEIEGWQSEEPDKVTAWGTALLIKRQLLLDIGMLDDQFFAYFEDTDYSLRAIQAGYCNRVAFNAKVYHDKESYQPDKSQYPPHYYYYFTRNEYFFWRKHLPAWRKFSFFGRYWATVLGRVAGCAGKKDVAGMQATLDGAWHAMRGLAGAWNQNVSMPALLSKVLLWHPYLWANLLQGNFSIIFNHAWQRLKAGKVN